MKSDKETRRKALKALAVVAPAVWAKPVVDSVVLPAHANTSIGPTVLWTLSGVILDPGGSITGSFLFNASSEMYSNVSLTVSSAPSGNGAYVQHNPDTNTFGSGIFQALMGSATPGSLTGEPRVELIFTGGLTPDGGTVQLSTFSNIASCATSDCLAGGSASATILSGEVNGVII